MKLIILNENITPTRLFAIGLLLLLGLVSSCKKHDEWLDVKRSYSNVIPNNLKDLQAVLDNTNVMTLNYAQIGLLSADSNIIPDADLSGAAQTDRNAYLWAKDVFQGAVSYDWQYAYQRIEYANVVLEALK